MLDDKVSSQCLIQSKASFNSCEPRLECESESLVTLEVCCENKLVNEIVQIPRHKKRNALFRLKVHIAIFTRLIKVT